MNPEARECNSDDTLSILGYEDGEIILREEPMNSCISQSKLELLKMMDSTQNETNAKSASGGSIHSSQRHYGTDEEPTECLTESCFSNHDLQQRESHGRRIQSAIVAPDRTLSLTVERGRERTYHRIIRRRYNRSRSSGSFGFRSIRDVNRNAILTSTSNREFRTLRSISPGSPKSPDHPLRSKEKPFQTPYFSERSRGRNACVQTHHRQRPYGLPTPKYPDLRGGSLSSAVRNGDKLLRKVACDLEKATSFGGRLDPWSDVGTHHPSAIFEEMSPKSLSIITGAREAALRNENLIDALESADETLAWLRAHMCDGTDTFCTDPILSTSGAVLENLKQKLGPILNCKRVCYSRKSTDDMLRRADKRDMTDAVTFTLIMLARIAKAFRNRGAGMGNGRRFGRRSATDRHEHLATCYTFDAVGEIDPDRSALQAYIPFDCSVGVIDYLTTHAQRCGDPACATYIASVIAAPSRSRIKLFAQK
nr:multifunctional expression regulator UL54 [Psittacid alphaherpesvirus 6]